MKLENRARNDIICVAQNTCWTSVLHEHTSSRKTLENFDFPRRAAAAVRYDNKLSIKSRDSYHRSYNNPEIYIYIYNIRQILFYITMNYYLTSILPQG